MTQFLVTLDNGQLEADLLWPDGKPLPVPGDTLIAKTEGTTVGMTITARHFAVGQDGDPNTFHVRLEGTERE